MIFVREAAIWSHKSCNFSQLLPLRKLISTGNTKLSLFWHNKLNWALLEGIMIHYTGICPVEEIL